MAKKGQTKPQTPPNDETAMAIILQALHDAADIDLRIDPLQTFTLVSMLQLVMRHPHLSANMMAMARSMAVQLTKGLIKATGSPEIGQLVAFGFDPAHDRDRNGRPLGPNPTTTLDLAGLIRQAIPQIYGSDERDILSDFLGRNMESQCLVEIDLEQVISQ